MWEWLHCVLLGHQDIKRQTSVSNQQTDHLLLGYVIFVQGSQTTDIVSTWHVIGVCADVFCLRSFKYTLLSPQHQPLFHRIPKKVARLGAWWLSY